MPDIEKQANDLFKQLEDAAKDLGEETKRHYNDMVTAYHELALMIWNDQFNKAAPELRLFKIVVLPEEEAEQTFCFTGSLLELGEKLFKIISELPPELITRPRTPLQLRYSIKQTISFIYNSRTDAESIDAVTCSPVKYVVTIYPGIAERVEK